MLFICCLFNGEADDTLCVMTAERMTLRDDNLRLMTNMFDDGSG